MEKLTIAVIGGGNSSEAEVSLRSVATVYEHFDKEEHRVFKVIMLENDWYVDLNGGRVNIDRSDFSFILDGERIQFTYAFIVIHGTPGEDGKLQAYFDLLQIPYNTCGHDVSAITFDKWYTILTMRSLGYPCAASLLIRDLKDVNPKEIEANLGFPVFVKPCDAGSSYGVSRVISEKELEQAIKEALQHGTKVLIEAEMKGVEVTCGVYENDKGIQILEITEVVSENDFFDYEAKYKGKAQEITPARISTALSTEIKALTKQIYKDLGMKGMARIDFIIVDDQPQVLEINTTPGMTEASFIPQQVKYCGLTIKEFCNQIVAKTK